MAVYVLYKVVRGEYFYWPRIEGIVAPILALPARVFIKVIVDFSG